MAKVKFEQIGALGVITLTDTPLNLLGNEYLKGASITDETQLFLLENSNIK